MKAALRVVLLLGMVGARAAAASPAVVAADAPVIGHPSPTGADSPLTLDECVAAALAGNAQLESERRRLDELKGQGWQAMSTGLPSLDLAGTWSRSRDPSFLLDESFGTVAEPDSGNLGFLPSPAELAAQSFWRASIGGDWELNPLRILNARRGVRTRFRQHDHELASALNATVERTMTAFHEVSLAQERVTAVEVEVAAHEEFLRTVRSRFELELATELDTLRAAVALANRAPELRRARKELDSAASRLNILMGRPPLTPVAILPVTRTEKDAVDPVLAAELARERHDLRALELSIEFLDAQRGVLRADQRPSLTLDGRYGYVARTAGDLADRTNDFWTASVTLNIPLFDGFSTKGRVDEVEGTIARTRTDLGEAQRQAELEAVIALQELEVARENLAAAELNLSAAEEALAQVTRRWELGRSQWLDVLNAQTERFQARSNLSGARFEVLARTATLKRAMGLDPRTPLARVAEIAEGGTP